MSLYDGGYVHTAPDADPLAYAYAANDDAARFLLALSEEPYEPERIAQIDYSRSVDDIRRTAERALPAQRWTDDLTRRLIARLLNMPMLTVCNRAAQRCEKRYIAHLNALGVISTFRRRIEAGEAQP